MDFLLGQSVHPKEIRNSNSSIPCVHSSELRCKKQMFQTAVALFYWKTPVFPFKTQNGSSYISKVYVLTFSI